MLKQKSMNVSAPITTGTYTATFKRAADGKTPADTILTFELENGRLINKWVNNNKVIFTDDNGVDFTSEDFFIIGLKRQLKMYDENIDSLEVLSKASEVPVTLWVVVGEYTNIYSSKPSDFDSAELGIA